MLSFTTTPSSSKNTKASVNLLPCKIRHTGPVPATKKHWSVTTTTSTTTTTTSSTTTSTPTSYFRGRKLLGRDVPLPAGYTGCVLSPTTTVVQPGDDDETSAVETTEFRVLADFDTITVWGHEQTPADDDGVLRGVDEWIWWAGKIHSWQDDEEGEGEGGKA